MDRINEVLAQLGGTQPSRRIASDLFSANLKVVDDLILEIKKLNTSGRTGEAARLIEIAQRILDNNRAYKALIENLMGQRGNN